jgi:hypothetical protein
VADVLMGGIIINEILADPDGANNVDTDGNGIADGVDEYVELYNTSATAIDISGVQLWSQGLGYWFTFPSVPPTILQPGGHALIMTGVQSEGALPTGGPDDLFFEAGRGSPLINNTGDNVVVYDPDSDGYIVARFNGDALGVPPSTYTGFSATTSIVGAGENFGNDIDGFSIQREGDGANTFVNGSNGEAPTPGTTNVCMAHGPTSPRRATMFWYKTCAKAIWFLHWTMALKHSGGSSPIAATLLKLPMMQNKVQFALPVGRWGTECHAAPWGYRANTGCWSVLPLRSGCLAQPKSSFMQKTCLAYLA